MTDESERLRTQSIMFELAARANAEPDLAAARATAEPQRVYADLLQRCPVREIGENMWSLGRMDDVLFVNKHPAVEQGSKYLGSDRPAIPLGLDGAAHRKYRRLLDPVFTAKRVQPLAPQVRRLASELIDRFIDLGQVDAYRAWCEPLPSTIFLSIMGLPMEDLTHFLRFKDLVLGNESLEHLPIQEKMARYNEAVVWIHDYFDASIAERNKEAEPRDDMIGWLLTTEVDGERLNRMELLDILGLLMIAGLDTVTASLACFISYFARHRAQKAKVVADPGLIRSAIEELMRFESPVTDGMREVTAEITLPSGQVLPAGSHLHISWSSANLDPEAFPDPLQVDLARTPNRHIGFASGYHRCLGSHLARMEMLVALQVWHERLPDYRIARGVELSYTGNPRAPHTLPLEW